jgi:iron complex transport system ATP-binding protein
VRALDVAGLSVRLGAKTIVDDVSFGVEAGEWLSVIGPNGAGKSTVLNAVAGLLPRAGDVRLHDASVDAMSRRALARRLAVVAQTPTVPPAITVFDYVLLGRTPHIPPLGREGRADLDAAHRVCERLDLTAFAARRLETLSGGERQRAFLARALAQLDGGDRGLLLLDEPTSALDIGHQQEVLELIDTLRGGDRLTVVSTMHELSAAGQYADRLLLLSRGRVAAGGTPAEVLTAELLERHYRARVRVIDQDGHPVIIPMRPSG